MINDKFKDWGVKIRRLDSYNYYSIWQNLKTVRLDKGKEMELPVDCCEFYDVGITTRCNAGCPFCYVSAGAGGTDNVNICDAWERFISRFPEDEVINVLESEDQDVRDLFLGLDRITSIEEFELKARARRLWALGKPVVYTKKPFQIAIGSTGEGTVHPQFVKFLETVYRSGVVPNYTTNGILLSDPTKAMEILEATKEWVGGVAVSFGNPGLREYASKAIDNVLKLENTKVMIHHIISSKESVDDFVKLWEFYDGAVHYHVLLPLMKHGRSTAEMEDGVFEYLAGTIRDKGIKNVAFGANFLPWMEKYPNALNVYEYPREAYSKNLILGEGENRITPSSFDLTTIMTI